MPETTGVSPREERIATAGAALASRADPGPTALGSFTDEQLRVLSGPANENTSLLTPWLDSAAPDQAQQELLLASAARGMLAAGVIGPERTFAEAEGRTPDDDPDGLVPAALPAGIIARRRYSQLLVTITDVDEPERGFIQLFADRDGTVMQEQVSGQGVHHFTMCTIDSAMRVVRVWMLGSPQEESHYSASNAAEVWTGTMSDLRSVATLSAALNAPKRRVAVQAEDRAASTLQRLWVVRDDETLIALEAASAGDAPDALDDTTLSAVTVSADRLIEQLAEFLVAG